MSKTILISLKNLVVTYNISLLHLLQFQKLSRVLPGRVVGGKMKGVREKGSTRVLDLPTGTVLAYQLGELAISQEGWL